METGSAPPSRLRRVSEPSQPTTSRDARAGASEQPVESEHTDALPVLASAPRLLHAQARGDAYPQQRTGGAVIPAVQAAAAAAGGFVAGAAVVGLVHRRQRRAAALSRGARAARALHRTGAGRVRPSGKARQPRAAELVQIVGSRSLLVDVHLLGGSDER
jgi:hypothetical protein